MIRFRRSLVALTTCAGLVLTGCSATDDAAGGASGASKPAATSGSTAADSVTVTDNTGEKTVQRPIERVVALDNRTFELLDDWGVKLEAAPRALMPHSLDDLKNDDSIVDIGNHREPNLEAIVAADPQLIVSGQRFTKYDDEIQKLNPQATLVEFEPREGEPLDAELIRQTEALGKIFDKEAEAEQVVADFKAALERAKKAYDGTSTVMAVNVSGGEIGYVAPGKGRTFGPLFDLIGLKPALQVDNATSDHKGDDISVEAIAEARPDHLLVLDRDAAISKGDTADYQPAEQVIEKSVPLQDVPAVKDGNVYYAPKDTYTNESIITYTEILNGIADQLEKAGE